MMGDSSIQSLNLSRNEITDIGARQIAEMMYINISLNALFLNWNWIKGDGLRSICKGLNENAWISVIDFSFNSLGSLHFQK